MDETWSKVGELMTFSSDNPLNTNQLPISLDINPGEPNFEDALLLYLRRIANAVNTKASALFLLQENANFGQWFQVTTPTSVNSQQNRNSYRLTVDLVALNGGVITPAGATLSLSSSTIPVAPIGYKYPVEGFGGALDSTGVSYFPSDPNVTITYTGSTNTFTVINNTGNNLTQCYFVINYLKN
jgi:hypothetical protein